VRNRRLKQHGQVEQRLSEEAKRLREEANALPPGPSREAALTKARQAETASHIFEWVSSPGLRRPE
jgi:hypothetical protein